jgi:hypothetical protein
MGVTLRKLVGHLVDWTCKCQLPLVAGHLDQIAHGLVVDHGYWTVRVSIDDGDAGSGSGEGWARIRADVDLPASPFWFANATTGMMPPKVLVRHVAPCMLQHRWCMVVQMGRFAAFGHY